MPTGYTDYILKDEVTTGKDFLKICTKAFGYYMNQREQSLDISTAKEIEISNRYFDRISAAITNLKELFEMDLGQMTFTMTQEHYKNVEFATEMVKRYENENVKLIKIKDEVEKWQPPTDKHKELKKFALEQIDMSMNSDELVDIYIEKMNAVLDTSTENVLKWHDKKLEEAVEELNMAYKMYKKEFKRVDEKNQWIKELLDSLEDDTECQNKENEEN